MEKVSPSTQKSAAKSSGTSTKAVRIPAPDAEAVATQAAEVKPAAVQSKAIQDKVTLTPKMDKKARDMEFLKNRPKVALTGQERLERVEKSIKENPSRAVASAMKDPRVAMASQVPQAPEPLPVSVFTMDDLANESQTQTDADSILE